jgi:nucleoside-diphosphate-sugar epimerase
VSETVLVTGAAGFLGSAVCASLSSQGYLVRPAVRQHVASDSVEVAVGDIGPGTDWAAALVNVYGVVHCAARVHVMDERAADSLEAFRRVNTEGTLNLARQAVMAGVKRFVFVSTLKVNGEATLPGHAFCADDMPAPQDSYSVSKHEAEVGLRQLAQVTGLEVVIVRPPLIYGPEVKGNFATLLRVVALGLPLPLGAINNARSLVALENMVDLLVICLKHPAAAGQIFLISDREDVSTTELLVRTARALKKRIILLPVPTSILKLAATLLGKHEVAQRICGSLQVDISKTCDLLDWKPVISLDEGLRRAVQGIS